MKQTFLLMTLLAVMTAGAQQSDSLFLQRLTEEIMSRGEAYDNLRVLTKHVGPRLAGSPGMVKAEAWGRQAMERAGADRVWMQQCMVPHWVRGGKDRASATGPDKKKKALDVIALGNSVGSMKALTAPVIEVASFDELEQKKESVKGKIVFYNYKFRPDYVRTFLAYRDASPYRGNGPSRAARHGAVGVIVRSLSHSTDNFPHTGSTRYADSLPKLPAVAVGLQDADWLSNTIKKGATSVTIHTHGRFLPDTIGHNVIGELRGSVFPDEYITVGGHLDSWDNCEGAHDDGAGCVQTIEVLRAFKALGYVPKRTIRFVLFANEENGLRGGNKYADEAKEKAERHLFALESDAGGFTPRGFGFTMNDTAFRKVLGWQPLLAALGGGELSLGGGGADIGPLNRALGTPVAGLQPDSQRYFDYHHARNDTFEAVNKRELLLGALNMAALIYLVDQRGL